jgi:FKBP-type peptidyl-prolyl cis-trans isomerase
MIKRMGGLKILDEREGEGQPAQKGDRVIYNYRIFLSKGDEAMLDAKQADQLPKDLIRIIAGESFVDHGTILGSRQTIAGVEDALMGMKAGGYRKVRSGPHLAYRDTGIPDLIPPGAVLALEIWLRAKIEKA